MVIKKIFYLSLILTIAVTGMYIMSEPNYAEAVSASSSAVVTLNVTAGISISSPGNTSMSTNLGLSTNTAVGTTTWNVATNDSLGYTLALNASTNPAMQSGLNYVDDYATTTNPSTWSVSSGNAKFGFSALGADVNTTTWGTGTYCNGAATSTVSTTLKYYGFYTAATTTASRNATTTPSGVDTTVCYAVQQNGVYIPSGVYTATITATATGN